MNKELKSKNSNSGDCTSIVFWPGIKCF